MIQISDLDFDLDMVVTFNQEAQTLLQRVEDASASVRLSLNLGKTNTIKTPKLEPTAVIQ